MTLRNKLQVLEAEVESRRKFAVDLRAKYDFDSWKDAPRDALREYQAFLAKRVDAREAGEE